MFLVSMTKTVLKSLFSKPATLMYPFEKRQPYNQTRGSVQIDIKNCIFCSLCQKKCPTRAIIVDKEAKTWEIERFKCILCNYCVDTCPKKCLQMSNTYSSPLASAEKHYKDIFSNA